MSKLPRGFSGFVNEETILVNDPIFSRIAVPEYVTHPKKKLNKLKKIGNFATHSSKEVFMICLLCDGKHDLDEYKSFKERGLKEKSRFYLSRNCAMTASLKYVLVTAQETVRKQKNAKFTRKGTRLLCMVIILKNRKKNFHKKISQTVNMSSEVVSMCVVPVMVRHKLSTRVVKT